MAKTVFEKINSAAVKGSERIFDAVCTEEVENGTFGYLEELAEGEEVIYTFKKGTKAGKQVVVAGNPEWDYDTSKMTNQRRDKFSIEAGTPFRAYVVKANDEYGFTIAGFTSDSQDSVADKVQVKIDSTTGKLVAGAVGDASTEPMVGTIMRHRVMGGKLVTVAHEYGYTQTMWEVKIDKASVVTA